MLKDFIQTLQMWGMDSVFLVFPFILHADDGNIYKFKCVIIYTLEEYVYRDDATPGQGLCFMWCCIVFQSRADKNAALEESVIQARARVMTVDCIMSILGLFGRFWSRC